MQTICNGTPDKLILIKESKFNKVKLDAFYGNNYVAIGIPDGAEIRAYTGYTRII